MLASRKIFLSLVTVFVLSVSTTFAEPASIRANIYVNGELNRSVVPKEASLLEIEYLAKNEEGKFERLKDFKPVMGKTMHLVLIKSDLSQFAHFHPFFEAGTGLFQAPIHLKTLHPDNQDAKKAMPEAGEYLAYVESHSKKHGLIVRGLEMQAAGTPVKNPLVPDVPKEGIYTRYLTQKGAVGTSGDHYQVELKYEETPGAGGTLFHFFLDVKVRNNQGE